jgi:hypothetical protein
MPQPVELPVSESVVFILAQEVMDEGEAAAVPPVGVPEQAVPGVNV